MQNDHHLLNWYEETIDEVAGWVQGKFGVTLNAEERSRVSNELYRAVNDAKVREAKTK